MSLKSEEPEKIKAALWRMLHVCKVQSASETVRRKKKSDESSETTSSIN